MQTFTYHQESGITSKFFGRNYCLSVCLYVSWSTSFSCFCLRLLCFCLRLLCFCLRQCKYQNLKFYGTFLLTTFAFYGGTFLNNLRILYITPTTSEGVSHHQRSLLSTTVTDPSLFTIITVFLHQNTPVCVLCLVCFWYRLESNI